MIKLNSKVIADSYNSWLIIDNDKDVCSHSLSMMEGVDAFCSLTYKEEEERFYINISKFLNLKELLNNGLNEEGLFSLALQAVDMRIEAIKFLLPTEGIVYDLDLSYYKPESKTLHMVFLPNRETSVEGDFINWLNELIDLSSLKETSEKVRSLMRYLNSEEYTLINLKQRLILFLEAKKHPPFLDLPCPPCPSDIKKAHTSKQIEAQIPEFRPSYKPEPRIISTQDRLSFNNNEALYIPKKQGIRDYSRQKTGASRIEESQPKKILGDRRIKDAEGSADRDGEPNTEQKQYKVKRLALILSQIALVLIYLLSLYLLREKVEPLYKLALGLFIFFGLIDYVILKKLLKSGYSFKKEEAKKESEPAPQHKKAHKIKKEKKTSKNKSPELIDKIADINRTLCLSDFIETRAQLVNKQNGAIAVIDKQDFRIGREGYQSDLGLPDKSVGRFHAFIRTEGNRYYLIDNTSVNGTFVNGIRISPGEYNEIMTGDEIVFARIAFQFLTNKY